VKHLERKLEELLSVKLTRIVEESKTLLKLRSEIGRLPKGILQKDCINQIDKWFDTALNSLMHLGCQESQTEAEALSLADPVIRPNGLLTEIHKELTPDDENIPF